jgi:membrane protein implicated in regulation of membrane protease activity
MIKCINSLVLWFLFVVELSNGIQLHFSIYILSLKLEGLLEKVAEAEVLGDRGNLEEQVALERKEEEVEEEVVMAEVMEDQDNLEEVVVVEVDGEETSEMITSVGGMMVKDNPVEWVVE